MAKRVYVMMSLQKDIFVQACRLRRKLNSIPGYPWQVLGSLETARNKCRVLNCTSPTRTVVVYFFQSLYSYTE